MSSSERSIDPRFRGTLIARVENVRALLDALELLRTDEEACRQVLAELHTLKGEARMLGLKALAELVHILEDEVGGADEMRFPLLVSATESLRVALAGSTSDERREELIARASAELSKGPAQSSSPAPDPARSVSEPVSDPTSGPAKTSTDAVRRESAKQQSATLERNQARWVQVDSLTVDDVCEALGELSLQFGRLRSLVAAGAGGKQDKLQALDQVDNLSACRALLDDCTLKAWTLRLVPLAPMLRDLAAHAERMGKERGKDLRVTIDAEGVQLERNVVDQLWDSLIHLVQNSVDHGLELAAERGSKPVQGNIKISARSRGPNISIRVSDDGRGIDAENIRGAAVRRGVLGVSEAEHATTSDLIELIFDHGFSTRAEVGETAGRGVGLDVVRRRIESLGGGVTVETVVGEGTKFDIQVPFTITRESVLVIDAGGVLLGLPARQVLAVLGSERFAAAPDQKTTRFGDETLPLRSLCEVLQLPKPDVEGAALVLELSGRRYALRVPRVIGEQKLIRRPADALLAKSSGVGASALLDDGRLVLLLDLGFVRDAIRGSRATARPVDSASEVIKQQRVLVADDSPLVSSMIKEILTGAGLHVVVASDGKAALDRLREFEPDLVISDLEMPRMNGFELLEAFRKINQRVPFVMLTTRGSVEDRQRATTLGANAYLLKTSFSNAGLLDVVRRFVRLNK